MLVILELSEMLNTASLPSLPGPLWLGVIAPDRALSIGQIELNGVLLLNWIVLNRTDFDIEIVLHWNVLFVIDMFWHLTVCK